MKKLISFIIVLLVANYADAQQEPTDLGPLITDRPDATESPNAIPKGYLQVETGSFFESYDNGMMKSEDFTLNTTLIRLGIIKNVELRIGWNLVNGKTRQSSESGSVKTKGLEPLLLGGKINISPEKGCWPEFGLLGHVYLPFAAGSDYKPENTGADFRFSFAHTLNDRSSLSYNLGAQWGDDSPEIAYIYTLAYGHGFTDNFGFFLELYGDLPENSMANHYWDAGLTYLISDSVQLDASVGTSFTDGQDILISGGLSFRVPLKNNSE